MMRSRLRVPIRCYFLFADYPSRTQKASWSGTIRLREDVGFRYRLLTTMRLPSLSQNSAIVAAPPLGRKNNEGTAFLNLNVAFYAPADPVRPTLHPVVARVPGGRSPASTCHRARSARR